MYQVIARKYRPQSFEEVVNQNHVKQTLVNALTQGRVAHGYIFSGPRGTGKTTMARILAKALNCEKGPTDKPCQQCSSCREIAAGNAIDVIEIDAASNRRIDDIRELRENVRYRPARDRYKVFIIDEAHQITSDAFNALLKTLEEPPEWVVFILCTTEPQSFPATIVSRCQSFQFRIVEMDEVVAHLKRICEQENIVADTDALVSIALAGDGSIRDSLSTLDQAIASFGAKLSTADVRDLLGAIPSEMTEQLLRALQESEPEAVLRLVDRLFREGRHLQHFCGELTRQFRNLLVMKVSGTGTTLVTAGAEERNRLAAWVEVFSLEDLTRYLNLLLDLYRDLQHAPQPRFRFEIGLLKLVYAGRLQPIEKILAEWNGGSAGPAPEGPNRRAKGDASRQAAGTQANAAATSEPKAFAAAVGSPVAESAPAGRPLAAPGPSADRPSAQADDTSLPPPASQAPAAAVATVEKETNGANGLQNGELKQKLVQALRRQGDESVADAVDHGTVASFANKVEIRSLADYQTSLEFSLSVLEDAVAEAMGRRVRVLLGDVLESPPQGPAALSNTNTGSDSVVAAEGDAAQRALADPEVQKIQQLFGGRVREVRNLRGYSS